MIDYVVEENIDDRILNKASQILRNGGLLCFPTETKWLVACDPFNKNAVEKLYRLRHIENTKHLTILCESFQKAMEIAFINDGPFRLIKKVVPGPYTFIFEAQKKITKNLKASKYDHQVGIHFPKSKLARSILENFGEVLICSPLTHEMISDADPLIPLYSAQIEDELGRSIDLIIDPGELEFVGMTTIIDFTTGIPEIVREGVGDSSLFR